MESIIIYYTVVYLFFGLMNLSWLVSLLRERGDVTVGDLISVIVLSLIPPASFFCLLCLIAYIVYNILILTPIWNHILKLYERICDFLTYKVW